MKNQKIFSVIGFLFVLLFIFSGCEKDKPEPVVPPVEKPDVTFNVVDGVSKAPIKVITLEWESFNATTCTLDSDTVALEGSKVFEIPEDITFTFVVTGEGGTTEKNVEVKAFTVEPLPLPNIVFFTADQSVLPEGGGGTWLSWEILNAFKDSVSINGIAQTDTVGSYYTGFISDSGNTDLQVIYTLIAKGPGGTKTALLTLTIPAVPPPPPLPTAEDTLCMGPWYLIKLEFMTPPSTEWVEYEIFECYLDNFFTFYRNPNIWVNNFGPISCNTGEPQTTSSTWSMIGNLITIVDYDDYIYLEIFDGTKLVGTNYSGSSDEQVRRTYAHQPLQ